MSTGSLYFRTSPSGVVYTALELYNGIYSAFYHMSYLLNTKNFKHPVSMQGNRFYMLSWRPSMRRFREFYVQNGSKGRCLYVNTSPMQFYEEELSTLISIGFGFDFSVFLKYSISQGLRLYGRFVDPNLYSVPFSMIYDSSTQSTIQAYAILGLWLLKAIYANFSTKQAREILYEHQERVQDALFYWESTLSEDTKSDKYLSNLQPILTYEEDAFESSMGAASTTAADFSHSSGSLPPPIGGLPPPTGTSASGSSKGSSSSKGTSKGKRSSTEKGGKSNE